MCYNSSMAEEELVEKQYRDGRLHIRGVGKPLITKRHVHPHYRLEPLEPAVRTRTGHLKIFDLVPDNPSLPKFSARLDEKDGTVDLDIEDAPEDVKRAFYNPRMGWGHRTQKRTSADPLRFDIRIKLPDGKCPGLADGFIFEGSLELTELWLRAHLEEALQMTDSASCYVSISANASDALHAKDEVAMVVTSPDEVARKST